MDDVSNDALLYGTSADSCDRRSAGCKLVGNRGNFYFRRITFCTHEKAWELSWRSQKGRQR